MFSSLLLCQSNKPARESPAMSSFLPVGWGKGRSTLSSDRTRVSSVQKPLGYGEELGAIRIFTLAKTDQNK